MAEITTRSTADTIGAPHRRKAKLGRFIQRGLMYLLFVVLALVALYPLMWLVTNSFKTEFELFEATWSLPSEWHWENYVRAWEFGIARYILNSVFVTVMTVVLTVGFSTLASYALARFRFPGRAQFFYFILGGLLLAPEVSLIPLFRILQTLGVYNTYWAMILPYVGFGIPFTTFLIRAHMLGLPRELEEAAFIDGAGLLTVLWHVIIPLSRPILVAAALLQAMRTWNEFMFALTFVEAERYKTLTIGVMSFVSALRTEYASLIAGLVISAIPMILLFLVAQKYFVSGLREGGIKG